MIGAPTGILICSLAGDLRPNYHLAAGCAGRQHMRP